MSLTKTNIIINTSFVAVHCWPDCDMGGVEYLKYPHRHTFTIQVKIPVNHDDRDIEFINFKKIMDSHFDCCYSNQDIGATSCEMLCQSILCQWPEITYVRVMEDGENGAEKIVTPKEKF